MSPADRNTMIDELQQRKQKEIDRLMRYRDKLQGIEVSLPEEKAPAEAPAAPAEAKTEDLKEAKTAPSLTPDELVKDRAALYPTVSKMKEFALVQYGSIFDDAQQRPVGDVLGTLLDATPAGAEEETPTTQ